MWVMQELSFSEYVNQCMDEYGVKKGAVFSAISKFTEAFFGVRLQYGQLNQLYFSDQTTSIKLAMLIEAATDGLVSWATFVDPDFMNAHDRVVVHFDQRRFRYAHEMLSGEKTPYKQAEDQKIYAHGGNPARVWAKLPFSEHGQIDDLQEERRITRQIAIDEEGIDPI